MKALTAVNVLDLPMNRCVDDANVTTDFRAVSKGFNVRGIDRQGLSQVSCAKSITHCKQLRKQISAQSILQNSHFYSHVGRKPLTAFSRKQTVLDVV